MNAVKERTEHLKADVDKYLVAERKKLKVNYSVSSFNSAEDNDWPAKERLTSPLKPVTVVETVIFYPGYLDSFFVLYTFAIPFFV